MTARDDSFAVTKSRNASKSAFKTSRKHVVKCIQLVSHWHANFSRLFCEFCRGLSCECRANVVRIFMCRELVAKVFNMLKNFMRIFSPKYFARLSRNCRATVARRSCECREPVAAKFWRIYNPVAHASDTSKRNTTSLTLSSKMVKKRQLSPL